MNEEKCNSLKNRNKVGLHVFISDIEEFRRTKMDLKQGNKASSSLTIVTIVCRVYLTT